MGPVEYTNFLVPVLLIGVASTAQGTAIKVAMDMTEGIIARFRTMSIFRPSVLTGHVLGTLFQSFVCQIAVTVVALGIGFRPNATAIEWMASAGLIAMTTFAVTWLAVALGLTAKSVETASNTPMFLTFLPFLGSGFVPTDSMPTALRWFAEYQPFTPVMDTLRGLLLGTGMGNAAWIAAAWCVGLTVVSFVWSVRAYNKDPR